MCHSKKDRWPLVRWFKPTPDDINALARKEQIMLSLLAVAAKGDMRTVCSPAEALDLLRSIPAGDMRVFAAHVYAEGVCVGISPSLEAQDKRDGIGCACSSACEFPCWARVGITADPCCKACGPLPEADA
jgi:hypothetical protein